MASLRQAVRFFISEPFFLLIGLAGICLYYVGIFHIGIYSFAHDPQTHIGNIEYIARSGDWWGRHHPDIKNPLFYDCAALLYLLAQKMHWDVWFTVRQFTLFLYLLYLYFALAATRIAVQPAVLQRLVFALIVFWPIGFTFPARITPDIAICTCGMAVFYFLLRWNAEGRPRWLALALLASGLSILFKDIGVANLLIVACMYAWPRSEKRPDAYVIAALLFTLFCIWITYDNPTSFHYRLHYVGVHASAGGIAAKARIFLTFSFLQYGYYIVQSPNFYFPHSSFWTTFLSSFFTGNFPAEPERMVWRSHALLAVIALAGFSMFCFNAVFWCMSVWTTRGRIFFDRLVFFAVAIPCGILLFFQLLVPGQTYGNARYMPHFVALFCMLYGRYLSWQRQSGKTGEFTIGVILATVFIITSVLLFLQLWIV